MKKQIRKAIEKLGDETTILKAFRLVFGAVTCMSLVLALKYPHCLMCAFVGVVMVWACNSCIKDIEK